MTKNVSFNVAVKFILVSGVPFHSQSFSCWELVTECAYLYVCMVVVFVNLKIILFRFLFVYVPGFSFVLPSMLVSSPIFCFTLYVHVHIYTRTHAHTNSSTGLWHPSSCSRKQCSECDTITQWHTHTHTAHTHVNTHAHTHTHTLICLFVWQN